MRNDFAKSWGRVILNDCLHRILHAVVAVVSDYGRGFLSDFFLIIVGAEAARLFSWDPPTRWYFNEF